MRRSSARRRANRRNGHQIGNAACHRQPEGGDRQRKLLSCLMMSGEDSLAACFLRSSWSCSDKDMTTIDADILFTRAEGGLGVLGSRSRSGHERRDRSRVCTRFVETCNQARRSTRLYTHYFHSAQCEMLIHGSVWQVGVVVGRSSTSQA
jgi:hypothetical protein